MLKIFKRILSFLEVPLTDPDNTRRGRLLNILVVGIVPLVALMGIALLAVILFRLPGWRDFVATMWTCVAFLPGALVVVRLNRAGKVHIAASVFLILITVGITVANFPALSSGVTMFYFVIPIIMASVLLFPMASFATALAITVLLSLIGLVQNYPTAFYLGAFGLFAIALVAWISARSLENALKELLQVNQELDQRVIHRTQELADAYLRLETQASELAKANSRLERQTHELSEANEKLKSLDRLKSKFVSDVTHELRTPISNLTIYIEMLRLGKAEKQERYLNVLQEEITRLARLVEDVLDLTRMELGTRKVEFNWVDLNYVIEQIVLANRLRAESKGLSIFFERSEKIPAVWADVNQMKQVVTNLVANAVNYTSTGSVTIMMQFDPANQQVSMIVQDTGMGVSPEEKPHLLERFYRGIMASQSAIPGSGLGLSIVKEIVDLHGGQIEVESQVGVGSTFVVRLPVGAPGKEPKTSPLGKRSLS